MSYKILVIEDNTDCRELFATMIGHLGFQVLQADDGEIGVQKALSEKPDLIFMDLGMPNMGGLEATFCLKQSAVAKDIPIIICTAWMAENHKEAALRSGAHEVVFKPVSIRQLQSLLLRYLPPPKQDLQVH